MLEEKDAHANIPDNGNDEAPGTDVCSALLSCEEFTPCRDDGLDLEEDEDDLDVHKFLEDLESSSVDFREAVRTFGLSWLPCFAHTLQLPIVNAIGKEVLF